MEIKELGPVDEELLHRAVRTFPDAGADVARRLFPGTTVEPSGQLCHWWVYG